MSPQPVPDDLLPWVLESLRQPVKGVASLALIAGDASPRRYFRLEGAAKSYIVVEAPPATEKNAEFIAVRELLAGADVRVPALFAVDTGRGFMLLEDLGDQLLLPELSVCSADQYYGLAFDLLRELAGIEGAALTVPSYDRAELREEFSRFEQWFVVALLGYAPSRAEQDLIARFGEHLIDSALEQPRVFVHRDFHSRNLMLLPDRSLALIDFQDAVHGPLTYDLASLLKDCYIRWPAGRVRRWALEFRDALPASILPDKPADALFLQWFDWMALQRHSKVLGTFARLHLRDGKDGYLNDLPLVNHYVEECLAQYAGQEPLFAEFGAWYRDTLAPLIARQPWSAGS